MKMLSLQRALRTLTSDYKCLKRQVQDFPFLLDKAIAEAKQEVSEHRPVEDVLSSFNKVKVPLLHCRNTV